MCCFSSTHLRVKTGDVLSSSFSQPRTVIARSTLQDTTMATNVIVWRREGEEVERGGRGGGEEAGRHTAEGLVSLQGGSIATTDDEGPVASPRTSLGAVHCL